MIKKGILMMAAVLLAVGMISCSKDPDLPTRYFGNNGGNISDDTDSLTIIVSANPVNGGTVTGGGKYQNGQTCLVTASANEGYVFTEWTENGNQVSTHTSYSFIVNTDRTLVANFSASIGNYTITAVATPLDGGTVSGGGNYQEGQSCTVTATANTGYSFTEWRENGNKVSEDASYTFTVTGNRTLVAHFTYNGGSTAPQGAINGLFSVSTSQQVYFSKGNLQYKASSNIWQFAANQYDYIGSDNSNISQTYSGWIDLFGWGTSGYNHGANCYQPWSTSTTNSDYYAYGQYTYNLYDQTGKADWGYNAISNGGNQTNQWRTPTKDEWVYVFNTRSTASGIRYAKATVNNVNGVILLPDDWSASYYTLNNTNTIGASFSSNTITASQWSTLEQHGAVFLPAAGDRNGTSVANVGGSGYYWSASYYISDLACYVYFVDSYLNPQYYFNRCYGQSVRLVCPAEN